MTTTNRPTLTIEKECSECGEPHSENGARCASCEEAMREMFGEELDEQAE